MVTNNGYLGLIAGAIECGEEVNVRRFKLNLVQGGRSWNKYLLTQEMDIN